MDIHLLFPLKELKLFWMGLNLQLSLRKFLILRRDASKRFRVEGIELNNLVSSMLQDYSYTLRGKVFSADMMTSTDEIVIKIPMEIQSEFENKYSIDDLLICSAKNMFNG